jgi:hypothetical protein
MNFGIKDDDCFLVPLVVEVVVLIMGGTNPCVVFMANATENILKYLIYLYLCVKKLRKNNTIENNNLFFFFNVDREIQKKCLVSIKPLNKTPIESLLFFVVVVVVVDARTVVLTVKKDRR